MCSPGFRAGCTKVIVVDGHSADKTPAAARRLRPGVRVMTQNRRGKGNALARGFAAATDEIIVTVDADGSADPAGIPRSVAALLEGAGVAEGTQFAEGGGGSDLTRLRRIANRVLSAMVNVLVKRPDLDCRCEHPRAAHQHYRSGSECSVCSGCSRYHPAPGRGLGHLSGKIQRRATSARPQPDIAPDPLTNSLRRGS